MYSCYCTCSYDGETLIHIQLFTHATYLYIALEKEKKKTVTFLDQYILLQNLCQWDLWAQPAIKFSAYAGSDSKTTETKRSLNLKSADFGLGIKIQKGKKVRKCLF